MHHLPRPASGPPLSARQRAPFLGEAERQRSVLDMPSAALSRSAAALCAGLALTLAAPRASSPQVTRGLDPHLDRSLLPEGCPACHRGHGVARSPLLSGP